jgi:hypothetical protein
LWSKIIIGCINFGIRVFCCIAVIGGGLTATPLYGFYDEERIQVKY